jgi:hypothetical protein
LRMTRRFLASAGSAEPHHQRKKSPDLKSGLKFHPNIDCVEDAILNAGFQTEALLGDSRCAADGRLSAGLHRYAFFGNRSERFADRCRSCRRDGRQNPRPVKDRNDAGNGVKILTRLIPGIRLRDIGSDKIHSADCHADNQRSDDGMCARNRRSGQDRSCG